jgi:hypothetical protein
MIDSFSGLRAPARHGFVRFDGFMSLSATYKPRPLTFMLSLNLLLKAALAPIRQSHRGPKTILRCGTEIAKSRFQKCLVDGSDIMFTGQKPTENRKHTVAGMNLSHCSQPNSTVLAWRQQANESFGPV